MDSPQIIIKKPLPSKAKTQIKTENTKMEKNYLEKKRIKGEKNRGKKLIREEKNFFSLLIINMLNINKKKGKSIKSKNNSKFSENIKKPLIRNKNKNFKKVKTTGKKTDNLKFEITKNKNGKPKTDIQKITIKNIKINKKNNLKDTSDKNEHLKFDTGKTETRKQKIELKKTKIDISKIENIKIDSQNREIKIEPIKTENLKQAKAKTPTLKNNMINEIIKLIKSGDGVGNKIFRIHLEPPELGKVYIRLSFSPDKKLEMKIYVQKTDVQHYFSSGIEHLKTGIENLGFKFDNPIIQTMSEFNAGTNQKDENNEKTKKYKFKILTSPPFDDNELKEEYFQVMDYLKGRVDIRV